MAREPSTLKSKVDPAASHAICASPPPPNLRAPPIAKQDPRRAKLRRDNVDPSSVFSHRERVPPIREKALNERAEPKLAMPSTDIVARTRDTPTTDSLEPKRATLLIEKEAPRCTLSSTDKA